MRKYIIGAIFGIALALSATTYADDIKSLIGQKIQGEFPIKINDKSLDKKAIVIDGSSYLPVRAMGDALGLDVSFNAELGIELKKKEVATVPTETNTPTVTQEVYDLDTINSMIRINTNSIITLEDLILTNPDSPKLADLNFQLTRCKEQLAIWEARKAALGQ